MKFKQLLFAASATILLAACSNRDNIEGEPRKTVEISNITITEEAFEPESPSKTRAPQAPQTIDLGDGIMAEVSLTEDTEPEKPAQTRAAIADGHYTIYVTKPIGFSTPGTSAPILATLSGTVQGGKFVRDAASQPLRLAPDTYTFACINDAISKEIHGYHGDVFALRNDKDNPMIGVTSMAVSGDMTEIPFVMKHRNSSRVRFQITSYTAEGHNVTGNVSFTLISSVTFYDMEGRWFGSISNSFTSGTYTFSESPVTYSAYTQTIKRTTPYRYFTSGAQGSTVQFNLQGGTIYGKSLAGKSFPLTAISQMQENKSYTCNITLKPSVLYLFDDGTVGALGDKGSRTPIGMVAREKTTTTQGMAMALKSAGNYIWGKSNFQAINQLFYPGNPGSNFTSYEDYMEHGGYSGYELTWDASTSTDNKVKANEQNDYPSFYYSAHYNPGVPVTGANIGKWFFPSNRDWIEFGLYRKGTKSSDFAIPGRPNGDIENIDINEINNALTAAGGESLDQMTQTSTERDADGVWRLYFMTGFNLRAYGHKSQLYAYSIRPFVYF